MKELILSNLVNIGGAVALFMLAYVSNMCFSLYYNIKIAKFSFDKTKLLNSFLKLLALGAGLSMLAISVILIPVYVNYIGISIDADFANTFSAVGIISVFLTTTIKYVKESYQTLKDILDAVVAAENITPTEETAEK